MSSLDNAIDRTVDAVLIPIIRREIPKLLESVGDMPIPSNWEKPKFVISIDSTFVPDEVELITYTFSQSSSVSGAPVHFIECGLDSSQSFYHREKPQMFQVDQFPYGWKSGPNRQFFTSIRHLMGGTIARRSVLLMETDAFPLGDFWLDRLNAELRRCREFLVAGSRYLGRGKLPADIANHLNGNAVYCVGDPKFISYLESWEKVLVDAMRSVPAHAYDVIVEWARHRQQGAITPDLAPTYKHLVEMSRAYSVSIKSIANFAGSYESSRALDEKYRGFRSLRNVEIVHVKIPSTIRQWLRLKKKIEMRLDHITRGDGVSHVGRQQLPDQDGSKWQVPAATELTAANRVNPSFNTTNAIFVGFPWATLIDFLLHKSERAAEFIEALRRLKSKTRGVRRVVTVCQHVHMLDYAYLFANLGVTDVFWSHKKKRVDAFPGNASIKIHPFPLYPVQVPEDVRQNSERRHLFSFIGASGSHYLTDIRNVIFDVLSDDDRGVIIRRDNWHYDRVVHRHQIMGELSNGEVLEDQAAADQFRDILADSIFSLCPSGTGPNSIRLWESIGAGAIPVILADSYAPPGDHALWNEAAIFWPETRAAVSSLPDRLAELAQDKQLLARKRHALRQLWLLYGPEMFAYDVHKLLLTAASDVDGTLADELPFTRDKLSDRARQILRGGLSDPHDRYIFLLACTSRAILDPRGFGPTLGDEEPVGQACRQIADDHSGSPTSLNFERAKSLSLDLVQINGSKISPSRLKVALVGRHANRTPLAYEPYARLFTKHLEITEHVDDADLLVVGFNTDFHEEGAKISRAMKRNPKVVLVVLSEEPLWDSVWSGCFWNKRAVFKIEDSPTEYHVLNHVTSRIFDFENLPYFITTNDDFFVRYSGLFQRNIEFTPRRILEHWKTCQWRAAFFAEKRRSATYAVRFAQQDIEGLSSYRTELAEAFGGDQVLRAGWGWDQETRRQSLPDWHLDKLATLNRKTLIASGIENTHVRNYVTEKVFDAFAIAAIPLYFASPEHRINDLVGSRSYLNLHGLAPVAAAERTASFSPDIEFAEIYVETQHRLCELFSKPETLLRERHRVVGNVISALTDVLT